MGKYVWKRLLHGLLSVVIVVGIVMVMVYTLLPREKVFVMDPQYTKQINNAKTNYRYQKWEAYGYLDYVTYADYLKDITKAGEIDEDTRAEAVKLGRSETGDNDSELTVEYVRKFTEYYESKGYTVTRLKAVLSRGKIATGGQPLLFASKDIPLLTRMWRYFTGIFTFDNIHSVPEDEDIGARGLTFTWYDPAYGGEKFSPALMGNGTTHKYLLYVDNNFPFVHQNLLTLKLGTSYNVNTGVDVFTTMTATQGSYVYSDTYYPTGHVEQSADNLHTATYVSGSRESSELMKSRFTDNYTSVIANRGGKSQMGYSFSIGIISVILAYILGLPIGVFMARNKDGLIDKLGTIYIVFIIAVPSLAYIFLFKAIGGSVFKLPTTFEVDSASKLMYVLPIVSLALPSIANLMKWMRRYMIDQQNSDYVKFARSGGLSEGEIFSKHIMKNAVIPIVHGIPASVLFSLTGAIITERVYVVPGVGNVLTRAINLYDNSVIVGVTLFYAVLSVVAIILGDVLMSLVDPRISYTQKAR